MPYHPSHSHLPIGLFGSHRYKSDFVKDLATLKLNEGWTVTYWSLQVLYYIGCQQVVIVGMDHSFQQSGKLGGPKHTQTHSHSHSHCVCSCDSLSQESQASLRCSRGQM